MKEEREIAFDPHTPKDWNKKYIQASLGLNEAEFDTLTDIIVAYMDANPHMWIQDLKVATALDELKATLLGLYPENFDRHEDTKLSRDVLQEVIGLVKSNRGRSQERPKPGIATGRSKHPQTSKYQNDELNQQDTGLVINKPESPEIIEPSNSTPRKVHPSVPFWQAIFPLLRTPHKKAEPEYMVRVFNPFNDAENNCQPYSLRTIASKKAQERNTTFLIDDVSLATLKNMMEEDGFLVYDEPNCIYRITPNATAITTSMRIIRDDGHLQDHLRDSRSKRLEYANILVCPCM